MALSIPLLLGIVAFSAFWPAKSTPSPTKVAGAGSSGVSAIPLNQTPEFSVLKPAGKDISSLGGLAKVSPAGSAPAYAYSDEINGVRIRVSQQELPDKFKTNSDEMTKLANSFNANRSLDVSGTTVYIGNSEKGPQSLVFQKDGLLVLISADREVSDGDWTSYIADLQS